MPSEAGYRVADIAWHSGPRAGGDAEQPALAIALDDGRCFYCVSHVLGQQSICPKLLSRALLIFKLKWPCLQNGMHG